MATAEAVMDDDVGVTDEPAGAVAERDTATSIGDDGPRFATTLRRVSSTGSPITTAVGGERAAKLTMARSAFAFTRVVAVALLFEGWVELEARDGRAVHEVFSPPLVTRSAGRSTVTVKLVWLPAGERGQAAVERAAGDSTHGAG
jgi:hypothetical protein